MGATCRLSLISPPLSERTIASQSDRRMHSSNGKHVCNLATQEANKYLCGLRISRKNIARILPSAGIESAQTGANVSATVQGYDVSMEVRRC